LAIVHRVIALFEGNSKYPFVLFLVLFAFLLYFQFSPDLVINGQVADFLRSPLEDSAFIASEFTSQSINLLKIFALKEKNR